MIQLNAIERISALFTLDDNDVIFCRLNRSANSAVNKENSLCTKYVGCM